MAHVLIVEDEAMLCKAMVRAISGMPEFSAVGAMTAEDAVIAMDKRVPDLLVTDLDLPDRSGLELLVELKKRKIKIPVIFVSAYMEKFAESIPRCSNMVLLEKPFTLDILREHVKEGIEVKDDSWTGAEGENGAEACLRNACSEKSSVRICVTDAKMGGEIVVRNGELWAAQDWEGKGNDAFFRLIGAKGVSCSLYSSETLERNLDESFDELMASVCIEQPNHIPIFLDQDTEPDIEDSKLEWSESEDSVSPRPTEAASLKAEVLASKGNKVGTSPKVDLFRFESHWNDGVEALLSKDYPLAEKEFSSALKYKPEDSGTLANLNRLRELGYGSD